MTPEAARIAAEAQAEDLVNGLAAHWLRLPPGCRRLLLATVVNPLCRSDELLRLAEMLREVEAFVAEADRRMADAMHTFADALVNLAPSRA